MFKHIVVNPLILEEPLSKIHDSSTSSNIQVLLTKYKSAVSIMIYGFRLDPIQEAFVKAAAAVASQIFHDFDDESQGDCINNPLPVHGSSCDILAGIMTGADPPDVCALEKGGELTEATGTRWVPVEKKICQARWCNQRFQMRLRSHVLMDCKV
ncbi:hypothetical protein L2E82_25158 [Cichorium intybus]|uniref:Uncharacterized protein n=1 Tax=Cichorium intybus TaxID=13427 RepID=A0ACB9E294_CICIN|nr:hypothetical protein L2E82_25158 [Cichorium intybus]